MTDRRRTGESASLHEVGHVQVVVVIELRGGRARGRALLLTGHRVGLGQGALAGRGLGRMDLRGLGLGLGLAHLRGLLHLRALRSLTTLGGDTVCHGDLRADNLLMRPDGGYVVIDWARACRGASWLDATLLTIELISGGTAAAFREADAVLTRLASENGATTQALADCLVGATAYYTWHSRQPAAEGMPDLRTYQRRLGDALTGWLKATSLS